jgi:FkbM family methyltransferase
MFFNELVTCRYGRMLVNRNDVYIGRSLFLYGEFSEWEAVAFREILRPGDYVVEVGANVGALTVPIAQHIGTEGYLLAIEPQRLNFQCLCGNVALASLANVQCMEVAVGAEEGRIGLPDWDASQPCNAGGMSLGQGPCSKEVPVITIDALNLPRLDFLKADVEGMETEVLCGALRTIQRLRPLMWLEYDREDRKEELRYTLRRLDYKAVLHVAPLYNPANWRSEATNVFPGIASFNLFCVPGERADVNLEGFQEVE